MNKLKVATTALRDYLGADARGVALLEAITEIANAQRKRIATLEESAAGTDATIADLRRERDSARNEAAALKEELHRESAKRAASESRERALAAQIKAQSEPAEPQLSDQQRAYQVASLLVRVRKRFKKLPVNDGAVIVEDFIKSFSYDEFAGLGMVLAACPLVNFPLSICANKPLVLGKMLKEGEIKESQAAEFVHWFRDAMKSSNFDDAIAARYFVSHKEAEQRIWDTY